MDKDRKIKVIRIIARLNIGGPAIHTIILSEGLNRDKFDNHLITGITDRNEGDMTSVAKEKGLNITVIPELGRNIKLWPDMVALWKLFRIIKKEKPDIIHTHTAKAGALGRCAAILCGVPVRVHSFHGHVFHDYFNPSMTKIFILIERVFARFTDQIIVVSEAMREDICNRFKIADKTRVSVVRLGLDLEKFKNIGHLKGQFRRELNIDKGILLVGIIGRLTSIKNHRLLLEAVKLLKNENLDISARFLIIGDGELREVLEKHAATLGIEDRVYFTGWRKDLPNIYADLDIVALTSLNEGTPLSLIEAMASQKAVVATAVGGIPDLIEDKKTGWLVDSNDAIQLKQAIVTLLRDGETRKRIGQAASSRVYEKYSKERLINNMESLYKNLLKKESIV